MYKGAVCDLCQQPCDADPNCLVHKGHSFHDSCLSDFMETRRKGFESLPCPTCQADLCSLVLTTTAYSTGSRLFDLAYYTAFLSQNVELLATVIDRGFKPDSELQLEALLRLFGAHNQAKAVCQLFEHGCYDQRFALNHALLRACEKGEIDWIVYILDLGADIKFEKSRSLRAAIANENMGVSRFLIEHGAPITLMALDEAAKLPRKDILGFLGKVRDQAKARTRIGPPPTIKQSSSDMEMPGFDEELRILLKCAGFKSGS